MRIAHKLVFVVLMVIFADAAEVAREWQLYGCGENPQFCRCFLGCEVNGGGAESDACDTNGYQDPKNEVVLKKLQESSDRQKSCDIMMCLVYCAKQLASNSDMSCLDEDFQSQCELYKEVSLLSDNSTCGVNCDRASPLVAFGLTALLIMVMQF